jgi:hypothetical protein
MGIPESKPTWWKREIIRPATEFERDAVVHVQRVLGLPITGDMDEATIGHIRGLQMLFNKVPTGTLNLDVAQCIENIRSYHSV